ncbi:MAG TPA: tetratricopeptide repeat-containing sensor histidine kinase [Fulvivirga sp.]|nr:tetratricopeptide repeat-containing sensor histidine kinase [Fulvivirga sp.]
MLFFQLQCFGQKQQLADSIISALKTKDLSNKENIQAFYLISAYSTKPDQSIFYANKLLDVAHKDGTYKDVLLAYIQIGGGYKQKGNLSNALEAYLKAVEISSENNDLISEGDAYTNIASLYTSFEDYNKSLNYYNKVIQLYDDKVDSSRLALLYINYGYATYKASLYDSSILLLKKAIYFAQYANYNGYTAYAQSNMALVMAKLGRLAESENELNSAMEIMERNQDHYGLSDCLVEIGGVYFEEGNIDLAIQKLTNGYNIAVKNGLKEQIQNGARFLSDAYQQLGDLQKALDFQTKYYTYRDSLINADQIRKLADLRTNYEVGQKQVEVDLLTSEKRIQQIIIFSTAGGALLVAILLGLVYKNYRDKNKINAILEEQKAQLEKLNTTKDKFFSIISHDLRGPVHAFSGISRLIKYAVEDKNQEELIEIANHVDKTADDLSGLLDNLLNWALQQQGHFPNVPEKIEVEELGNELKGIFSNMAKAKNIELTTLVPNNLALWGDKNTTRTIFRNLVNNALKFTPEGGKVSLLAELNGKSATVIVQDTGVGIAEDALKRLFEMDGKKSAYGTAGEKGLGLGLQLVYEFVEMNNGTIEVESEVGKGTRFIVNLPLFEQS